MRAALAIPAVALLVALQAPDPAPPPQAVHYRPPLVAPVADPFRPPDTPYGPGNVGLEYATVGGEPVHAAGAGEVTFAGVVGPDRYVVVLHADRLRTTYGRLAVIDVAVGEAVAAGQRLGTAGPAFIWTARLGEAYLDPAELVSASGHRRAWLVG